MSNSVGENIGLQSLEVKRKMDPSERVRYPEFAAHLRELRGQTGLKPGAFADLVGWGKKSLYRYEKGYQLPVGDEMLKIAKAFPGTIEWLLLGTNITEVQRWQSLLQKLTPAEYESAEWYVRLLGTHDPELIGLVDSAMRLVQQLALRMARIGSTMEGQLPESPAPDL